MKIMLLSLLCLSVVTVSVSTENKEYSVCPEGEFLNLELQKCQNCSRCPDNQIYRFACTNISDAVCSSFKEFNFGHLEAASSDQRGSLSFDSRTSRYDNDISGSSNNRPRIEVEGVPTNSSEDQYWKNLAFALIAVLCVLIIVATMVVWYVCRKLHASVQLKRAEDDDSDDADNGYVVIRSIRPGPPPNPSIVYTTNHETSNTSYHPVRQQRLVRPYRPKRRLLTEYDDDVFESEDSAGSRTSRRYLSSIPEHSDMEATCTQPMI